MRQDGLRTAVSGGAGFECLEVKQTRLLTHSMPSAVAHTRQELVTHSMAGSGRGRRDCRRGAALSSLFIKPTHRMARPPCRHMHRAGAWINPHKPRQGSQCLSCHTTCLIFRAHSLGGCCQQLAVTALGLVDGLLHRLHHPDSQQRGKATGALPSSPAGCRSGRAADETEAARARRRVLTLGAEGG